MATIKVDVVSAEEQIFSGQAKFVALPGEAGELGILPGHTPLITRIRPGAVRIEAEDGKKVHWRPAPAARQNAPARSRHPSSSGCAS